MTYSRIGYILAVYLSCCTNAGVLLADPPAAVDRKPVPAAPQLASAEITIRSVYKTEYAKKDSASRSAHAKKMVREAGDPANEPATRYVLLREARDVALSAGDGQTAIDALNAMTAAFDVNIADARLTLLSTATRKVTDPKSSAALAEAGLKWIDEAAASDDYEMALGKLAPPVDQLAVKSHDAALVSRCKLRVKEIRAVQDEANRARVALRAVQDNPDDAKANLIAGRFLCFSKGDFAKGLPMLVKSGDPAAAALASRDLSGADDLEKKLALGDAWCDFANKNHEYAKGALVRAQYWYLTAMKEAKGLARTRVMKKLRVLPPGEDFDLIKAAWDQTETTETSGGTNGPSNDVPETPGLLTGFDYRVLGWWGGHTKISSIRPVFVTASGRAVGSCHGPAMKDGEFKTIEAKPGYAVGAIVVDSGDRVFAIRIRFMRVHGSVLDPDDSYDTPWIGTEMGSKFKSFGGDGRAVIGARLLAGGELEGIGLIELK